MESCMDAAMWTNMAVQLLESIGGNADAVSAPVFLALFCFDMANLARLL